MDGWDDLSRAAKEINKYEDASKRFRGSGIEARSSSTIYEMNESAQEIDKLADWFGVPRVSGGDFPLNYELPLTTQQRAEMLRTVIKTRQKEAVEAFLRNQNVKDDFKSFGGRRHNTDSKKLEYSASRREFRKTIAIAQDGKRFNQGAKEYEQQLAFYNSEKGNPAIPQVIQSYKDTDDDGIEYGVMVTKEIPNAEPVENFFRDSGTWNNSKQLLMQKVFDAITGLKHYYRDLVSSGNVVISNGNVYILEGGAVERLQNDSPEARWANFVHRKSDLQFDMANAEFQKRKKK